MHILLGIAAYLVISFPLSCLIGKCIHYGTG